MPSGPSLSDSLFEEVCWLRVGGGSALVATTTSTWAFPRPLIRQGNGMLTKAGPASPHDVPDPDLLPGVDDRVHEAREHALLERREDRLDGGSLLREASQGTVRRVLLPLQRLHGVVPVRQRGKIPGQLRPDRIDIFAVLHLRGLERSRLLRREHE